MKTAGPRLEVRVSEEGRLGTQGRGLRAPRSWEIWVQDHQARVTGPNLALICTRSAIPAGRNVAGQRPHACLRSCEGIVSKQGQRPLLRSRSLWCVLRRRGGVDRVALERRVREAMDADPPPYHLARSNCVHFALHLLGHGPTLDPLRIDGGPISSVSVAQLPMHDPTPPPTPSPPWEPVNKCS